MKKLCWILPLILATALFGADAANDLLLTQRNSTNDDNVSRNVTAVASALLAFDGSVVPVPTTVAIGTTAGTVAAGDAVGNHNSSISAHGFTTAGKAISNLTNPSAITFLRVNADNTASALSAGDFRTAIGLGGAAVLSVGTTSGTVAAGDDSRIVAGGTAVQPNTSPALAAVTLPAGDVQTQINTTANTRRAAQGLNFDGTGYITRSGGTALGTSAFTIRLRLKQTGTAAQNALFGSATSGAPALYNNSGGALKMANDGVAAIGTFAFVPTSGQNYDLILVRGSGVATLYVDGTADANVLTCTNDFTTIIGRIGSDGGGNSWIGQIGDFGIVNRTLTAAEVLALHQTGQWPADCFPATPAGTVLNTSAFTNTVNAYDSFTGATADGFTASSAQAVNQAQSTNAFAVKVGYRVKYTYTYTPTSGDAPSVSLGIANIINVSALYPLVAGTHTVELVATEAHAGCYLVFTSGAGSYAISGSGLTTEGVVAAMDPDQPGAGLIAYDISGNHADFTLSATGVTWAHPASGRLPVGHIISVGTAPTAVVGAAAGTTPSAVTITGHDTAFTLALTTGTSCPSSGVLATLTFNTAYAAAPHVVFCGGGANGAAAMTKVYSTSTTTTFVLSVNAALTDATTYTFECIAVQ